MYKKKDGYYRGNSCKYKLIAHIEIKDSSFIYTPEGMYFSELTINNTNDESNQTEMSMSLDSSDITIGKIIDMKDYVHIQNHDTQEIYLITIQHENKTRVVRVTSVTYQKYKIGDTFDITNHIES